MRCAHRRLGVLLAAGAVLLSGCSGGDREDMSERPARTGERGGGVEEEHAAPHDGSRDVRGPSAPATERPDDGAPDRVSTFAIDVDTASWGYARRTLAEGRLPEPESVRPEEFVNSFRQDYPQPSGNGFAVNLDGARADADGWSLLRVGLATRKETAAERERGPAALTFVVDVSGSMGEPGRLDLVKDSLRTMIGQLRDEDSIALVSFSDQARTVRPMTRLGGEDRRAAARAAVDRLEIGGSTNLDDGLLRGYREAVTARREGAVNRVVLLSDALANTGSTSSEAILERVARERREHGVTLFGVGVGSEYGDTLMEQLTNKGDGHTVYVSDHEEAERVFTRELPRHVALRARDAKAQVAFDPAAVAEHRLIGYDNRRLADEDFREDAVDGGEAGPGHTVTALYAVRLQQGASGRAATATVRWQDPGDREPAERSVRISAEDLRADPWTEASPAFQVTVTAACFADTLRRPAPYAVPEPGAEPGPYTGSDQGTGAAERSGIPGTPGLADLARRARTLAGTTEDREVGRLADAIEDARRLIG